MTSWGPRIYIYPKIINACTAGRESLEAGLTHGRAELMKFPQRGNSSADNPRAASRFQGFNGREIFQKERVDNMAFKRIGNEAHEWLNVHSCNRCDIGAARETRAELE